jgi:TnpA family transposase
VLPSAETAAMLFWALLAAGQITMRKVDGWQTSLGVGKDCSGLGASVKHGWYPATEALDRFGSAAVGDPVYEAGDSLGKLVRTLYLCDYFGNPVFRTEILDLLNQGEAVHSLQRAVYNGMITAKQGRTLEELGAISGALTLLANIVMAWNTHQLQIAIDRAPADYPDEVLSRIVPAHHGTVLKIETHYTDTGGASDHVFALCVLLGFRFCPRLRDLP